MGALGRINAALTGIPVAADASVITTRVEAALGGDAMLAGFTAGAVATAVRRALTRASGWRDHDWRFIREEPQDPALHMALDEVLAREVAAGPPPADAADLGMVGARGRHRQLPVAAQRGRHGRGGPTRHHRGPADQRRRRDVRRARKHDHVLAVRAGVARGGHVVPGSYAYLDDWVIGALTEDLGISAWYQPLNDIASAQGKIGGAAQKRLAGGAVLHHVTMAYDIDAGAMTRVLRIGREKLPGNGIPSAVKRVDPLRRQTRLARAEIIDILAAQFRGRYGLTPGHRHRRRTARRPRNWPGRSSRAASGPPGCHDDTDRGPDPCLRPGGTA